MEYTYTHSHVALSSQPFGSNIFTTRNNVILSNCYSRMHVVIFKIFMKEAWEGMQLMNSLNLTLTLSIEMRLMIVR